MVQIKFGSLGIGVIKIFCTRILRRTDTDFHGFFKGFFRANPSNP